MVTPKPQVDTSRPHPARVYDYLLGGKNHYLVDEELGEQLPGWSAGAARQNRAFMHRAVAWSARGGIDQFLDIGTGIPTEPNLHQTVQAINPAARVAYVDNDPIVLAYAAALLVSAPEGATDYVQADIREPGAILEHARGFLDFDRPIALSLIAVLHFVLDEQHPYDIVRTLVDALPPGSHVAISHTSLEGIPQGQQGLADVYTSEIAFRSRTRAEVARFFDGLDPAGPGQAPGVVRAPEWFMSDDAPERQPSVVYVGVGRKP